MYKILIKKPQLPKDAFVFYTETTTDVNSDTNEVTKTTSIYETDNLIDLELKYEELLSLYTTAQIKLIQDLDVSMVITVKDNA